MTEREWLTCADPEKMLRWLDTHTANRKLWLFVCAVERKWWGPLENQKSLLIMDAIADGKFPITKLKDVVFSYKIPANPYQCAIKSVQVHNISEDRPKCADLIREIFGNPFRKLPHVEDGHLWSAESTIENGTRSWPALPWYHWRNDTIPKMARAIYEDRSWGDLPMLADACEEAGCDNADIINHLRGFTVEHVRGCWALDLLTGRE